MSTGEDHGDDGLGESPSGEQMRPHWRKKILHATLAVASHLAQGADVPPDSYQKPQGFSVMLNIEDPAQAERIFNRLSHKGVLQMSLAGDVLAEALWHAHRRIWNALDNQLWETSMIATS